VTYLISSLSAGRNDFIAFEDGHDCNTGSCGGWVTLERLTVGESSRATSKTFNYMRLHENGRECLVSAIQTLADCLDIGYNAFDQQAAQVGYSPSHSQACIFPVRPIPHMISSNTSKTPYLSQTFLIALKYPGTGVKLPAAAPPTTNQLTPGLL